MLCKPTGTILTKLKSLMQRLYFVGHVQVETSIFTSLLSTVDLREN